MPASGKVSVIESMTRIQVFGWTVRIWRTEAELTTTYNNADLFDAVRRWKESQETIPSLVHVICAVPRVSAVELVDCSGQGAVVYPEWP